MTTKHRIIEIVTIIAVTAFIVFMVRSCKEPMAFSASTEYQTTDCEWHGEYIEDLISELCCRDGIDYEDNWIFHCPECVGASYTNFKGGGCLVSGWLFVSKEVIDKIEPGESVEIYPFYKTDVYCNFCEYPLGHDWKLLDFKVETKVDLIINRK